MSENVKFSDKNKKKQTAITRLRFGKCLLSDVLHLFGKKENDRCDHCQVKENVKHFLIDCMQYNVYHVEMNDLLLMSGVVPSVENILGDAKWYDILWNFILQTERSL